MERLLDYFVPEQYDLRFQFYLEEKMFSGIVVITGDIKSETIKFHAVNLEIKKVIIDGELVDHKTENDTLVISDVKLGRAEITIEYKGVLNENMEGVYLSTYEHNGKTETIITTQFESHYAREAFPCIDEPEAKAVFALKMEMSSKFDGIMLSNMPEKGGNGDLHVFEPTPRMSTYLLAWVIGKFRGKTITNKHGVEITTYAALNQDVNAVDFANEIAARSLEFYDDNFKEPYPLKRCVQVALPDFEAGAMENWGLVTYRESMLLVGKKATLSTKKSVALTVAHELSHQWFGDLVTMKWWDDLWLNESFASVMEYYAVDYIHPEYHIFEGFFTGDAHAALLRDAYKDVQSVHQEVHDPAEIATLFDAAIVYSKGARLMLMLIRAMGWENFCKGVADYFNKYKYSNTVGDDLWQALKPYAKFDPKSLMHAFIDRPGYPVITAGKQQRFLLDEEMFDEEWPIPEILEDMSGHYVINYSEEEFEKRLEVFEDLSLEEKIRLLIDRSLIARTDLAASSSLIKLLPKFEDDDNAAIWSIILSIVANLKIFFDNDSKEEALFKQFVAKLVAKKLKKIGLKTKKSDDENTLKLRNILLALDYYAEVKEDLKKLAEMYLKI